MIDLAEERLSEAKVSATFSSMLKHWRKHHKQSQLDLSLEAGISQRHLSFLESARAKPSREMVLNLASAMELPLRERNGLLHVAGFAPVFKERNLDSEEMSAVQKALKMSLSHHEPYPALVADRNWNLLMANDASLKLIGLLGDPEDVWARVDPSGLKNIYRMTFHPEGMQPLIGNWDVLARHLFLRLQRELSADPGNEYLSQLLLEVCEWSDFELVPKAIDVMQALTPVVPMELSAGGATLKVFSMISSFGTALDITAEELKVETFFPADDFTAQFFRRLAD